jgi:hypothetical protein
MDDRAAQSRKLTLVALLALTVQMLAGPGPASGAPAYAARQGLELASAAAQSWSGDAVLVYVENDEPLDPAGASSRWGYLFYSASQERARVWSVRDGRIAVAENLDMRFDAPPVAADWLDSAPALAVAEQGGGAGFRKEFGGRLMTMLLMRGAFSEGDPDVTTWTFVYSAPGAPSLFVVVDATAGKVQRTWRG